MAGGSEQPLLRSVELPEIPLERNPAYLLFEERAFQDPTAVAVRFKEQTLSYNELNQRANQLARYLRHAAAGRGVTVGVCLERGPWLIAAMLAVWKCGASYIPLDPSHPEERLQYILHDAGARLVIIDGLAPSSWVNPGFQVLSLREAESDLWRQAAEDLNQVVSAEDPCYVIYTSGSTGRPKGVVVAHRALSTLLKAMEDLLQIGPHDRWLAATTVSFDIATLEWLLPLAVGAQVIMADHEEARDIRELRDLAIQSDATVLQGTPSMWRMLLRLGKLPPGLRLALCGGDALSAGLANQMVTDSGPEVWNLYGPTETTIWSTAHRLARTPYATNPPIGRPLANTNAYVLDEKLQPVPAGVPAELFIGGQGLAHGYLHDPDLTAKKFICNVFSDSPSERLYRTGDIVRWNTDGDLEFVGRLDEQVKIRGYRIELGEVEEALRSFPGVELAAAVVREDSSGEKSIAAYVAAHDAHPLWVTNVRAHLHRTLPHYMVPSTIISLTDVPLTPNGKIDRWSLPPPDSADVNLMCIGPYAPPENEAQTVLCDIWAQVLQVTQVGVDDDFFVLGGHSLLGTLIILRVSEVLGVDLTLKDLFEHSTIAALARYIDPLLARRGSRKPAQHDAVPGVVT